MALVVSGKDLSQELKDQMKADLVDINTKYGRVRKSR